MPRGRATARSGDGRSLDEALLLLARAIQQFHTYPATSPLCQSAVEACQRAIVAAGRECTFRVAPHELVLDEAPIGRGSQIEHELAKRLHAAAIAQVTIEQDASIRELMHFCCDLIACSGRSEAQTGFIEMLAEHGVNRIVLRPAYRPEVLPVGPPSAPVCDLIAHQRERREQLFASGGHVDHLYPPDKGWVRVDPSAPLPSVSLVDLALLADDPAALAIMLVRLTDDEGPEDGTSALAAKFSDVTTLFNALDPRVARVMFAKLARAVLELDTDHRQALLRRTILPGLLDGRIDGSVLRDFPDVDLAESICLLLDLETAAPEVVTTALARLDLSAERQASVMPLIEKRLQARNPAPSPETGLDAHARRLVRIEAHQNRSFAEFAAFDLALDQAAADTLVQIRGSIVASDPTVTQLECLWNLTRLEPNPDLVQRFLQQTLARLHEIEEQGRWQELALWLTRYRALGGMLAEARPDVSAVIELQLNTLCTPERGERLVQLAGYSDEWRVVAGQVLEALGREMGPSLLAALQGAHGESRDARQRGAVQLLSEHAPIVGPALVAALGRVDAPLERVIARVLGLAGHGYENALATLLDRRDEQTVREALRSLARIGTPLAASLVGQQIQKTRNGMAAAAEQTLWHFPAVEAQREVRNLLARREFMLKQPEIAGRLLDRVAQAGPAGLEAILQTAVPLQYRFWNPPVMRLGRKARTLLKR